MSQTCFVCKFLHLEMISIFHHPKKLDFILKNLLGLQAKQDDYLCKECCSELINAFESKQMLDQSNLKRLDNGTFFKEESNSGELIETMMSSEVPPVRSEHEINDESTTSCNELIADKETETLQHPETGRSEVERSNNNKSGTAKNDEILTENFEIESLDTDLEQIDFVDCTNDQDYFSTVTLSDSEYEGDLNNGKGKINNTFRNSEFRAQINTSNVLHTEEKQCQCCFCFKTYPNNSSLRKHLRVHTNERPYICKDCGKGFKFSYSLKSHRRIHSGEKPFVCNYCSRPFAFNNGLKRHLRVHTKEKPFECSICGDNFATSTQLKIHKRIHTGERLYSCPHCPTAFGNNSDLKVHERIHMNERSYVCSECGKGFNTHSNLRSHRLTHSKEKRFTCNICSKTFNRNYALTAHMRTHSNEKLFECSECEQNFASSSKLESHKKIHTGETPFACFYCSNAFKDDYGRKRHVRRMHPNENHQTNNETDRHDQTEIVISTSESERSLDLFEATEAKVMTNNSEIEDILQVSEGEEVWTKAQKRADVTAENEILSREPKKMVSNSLISEVKIGLINALKDTFTNLEEHPITHAEKEPTNDTEN